MINITVNGKTLSVKEGSTILEACTEHGIFIPTLCYMKGVHELSQCRVCLVEVNNGRLHPACSFKVADGMVINTKTDEVKESVLFNLELTASNHTFDCWTCNRELDCELLDLLRVLEIDHKYSFDRDKYVAPERSLNGNEAIVFDSGKCTLCERCVSTCVQTTGEKVISFNNRGEETILKPANDLNIGDAGCIYCGRCIQNCPVSAIKEKRDFEEVIEVIDDPSKNVIVQFDNYLKYYFNGEVYDFSNKLSSLFSSIGFDASYDLSLGYALHEHLLNEEIKDKPIISTEHYDVARYIEIYRPDLIENLSKVKSPHTLQGHIIKNVLAEELELNPEDTVIVSVLPSIGAKSEIKKADHLFKGNYDVDYVITYRELAQMMNLLAFDIFTEQTEEVDFGLEGLNYTKVLSESEYVQTDSISAFKRQLENMDFTCLDPSFDQYYNFNNGGNFIVKSQDFNIEDVLARNIIEIDQLIKKEEVNKNVKKLIKKIKKQDTLLTTTFTNKSLYKEVM